MSVLGIDFGSENCHIATVKGGGIEVLTNEIGQRITPSYVSFSKNCRIFGSAAKNRLGTNYDNTVQDFKRLLGLTYSEESIKTEAMYNHKTVFEFTDGSFAVKVRYPYKEVTFSILQITAMLLHKLKESAEKALDSDVKDCVLSVPSYFTDRARHNLIDAAQIAGLNVLKLMNDTAAAALSYGFYQEDNVPADRPLKIVFLQLGHTSLQVSVCSIGKNKLQVLATASDIYVGGRDFDNALVSLFLKEFEKKHNCHVFHNKRAIIRLVQECQKLKTQMTINPNRIPLNIDCFVDELELSGTMIREDFEKLCDYLIERIENVLYHVLQDAKLKPEEIDAVELVGGSARIPVIKSIVQKVFNVEPRKSLNFEEAVVRGCALQCAMLSSSMKVRDFLVTDVLPFPIRLYWMLQDKSCVCEISNKNTQFPFMKRLEFDNTLDFLFKAYHFDNGIYNKIGVFKIFNDPRLAVGAKFLVKVGVNRHGIFEVLSAKIQEESTNENNQSADKSENNPQSASSASSQMGGNSKRGLPNLDERKSKPRLEITSRLWQLPENELQHFSQVEAELTELDAEEQARDDEKNNLEEFLYDMKCKVENDLQLYMNEADSQRLKNYMESIEKWIYDENETKPISIIQDKRLLLKSQVDPFLKRRTDYEEHLNALTELEKNLYTVLSEISDEHSEYGCVPKEQKDRALKTLNDGIEWTKEKLAKLTANQTRYEHISIMDEIVEAQEICDRIPSSLMRRK